MSAVQDRLDSTLNRINSVLAERTRREIEALRAEDAAQEREDAERARRHNERKRQYQTVYSDAFRALGSEPPLPLDDDTSLQYRFKLYDRLRQRLAPDHELATVRSDDICSQKAVFENFEKMLLAAVKVEAARPSEANLPRDGSLIMRTKVDEATGAKTNEFYGTESFIKGLGRSTDRVLRFLDPKTRSVIMGPPLDRY